MRSHEIPLVRISSTNLNNYESGLSPCQSNAKCSLSGQTNSDLLPYRMSGIDTKIFIYKPDEGKCQLLKLIGQTESISLLVRMTDISSNNLAQTALF